MVLPFETAGGRVTAALLGVARRCEAQFGTADGVGVTLDLAGTQAFVGTNELSESVHAVQHGLGDGPCLTAVETGRVVWSGAIGTGERRWPRFTARAAALGLGSVLSAPVLSDDRAIGSLNLYARSFERFGDADAASALAAAASAAENLRNLSLLVLTGAAAAELASALDDSRDVAIAVGMLMHRHRVGAEEAGLLLGRLARRDGVDEATAARHLLAQEGGS